MVIKRVGLTLLALLAGAALSQRPDDVVDGFIGRIHRVGRVTMPYRLFVPPGYDAKQKYPMVIWLHGAGGAGTDNRLQIAGDQVSGTHAWTRPAMQAQHPAFVLVPQSPGAWGTMAGQLGPETRLVVEILESLKREFSIDPGRVYLTGQSNGGYGVWSLITQRPDLFAAGVPLCGGGDPRRAPVIVRLPIWAFHGDKDDVIPVTESREMIAAIRKAGGQPRYTEYKGLDHNIWTRTFKEPELATWLFAQHK